MAVQNINTYAGNAALGQGSSSGGGPIGQWDMKEANDAMDKLVQYDVLYKRDKWARNNLLLDQEAAKAQEMMDFPISDWQGGDPDIILGKIGKLNEMYNTDPKRIRLRPDGSNKDQVMEFQKLYNEIREDVGWANRRKTQMIAVDGAIAKTTNKAARARMEEWKKNYANTDIRTDILLPPEFTQFVPLKTPYGQPFVDEIVRTENKNLEEIHTKQMADLLSGIAAYSIHMDSEDGEATREAVTSGWKDFNTVLEKAKQQVQIKYGEVTDGTYDQKLLDEVKGLPGGSDKMILIQKANAHIAAHNEYAPKTKSAKIDPIVWQNGMDEGSYIKMLVGGDAGTVKSEVKTSKIGLGQEEDELKAKVDQYAKTNAQIDRAFREGVRQWNLDRDDKKPVKVDPLIKNSAIASLVTTPFQTGAVVDPVTKMYDIPVTTPLQNMFNIPINELTVSTGTSTDKVQTSRKNVALPIVSIQAEKVGTDANDTKIHVTYADPEDPTNKEKYTTKIFDRAGLSIPGNNLFGEKFAKDLADADAVWKRDVVGDNNPKLERFFDKATAAVAATGNTKADPIKLPVVNGKRDNSKMSKGKWYKMPDGSVQQYNPK